MLSGNHSPTLQNTTKDYGKSDNTKYDKAHNNIFGKTCFHIKINLLPKKNAKENITKKKLLFILEVVRHRHIT